MPELGAELPNNGIVRAKVIIAKELQLSSKHGMDNCSEAQTMCNVRQSSQECQGIEGNLHNGVFSDIPHAQTETP